MAQDDPTSDKVQLSVLMRMMMLHAAAAAEPGPARRRSAPGAAAEPARRAELWSQIPEHVGAPDAASSTTTTHSDAGRSAASE